ncbi:MAG TPA: hypothetical protein VF937_15815 [Chloroflexota bacterium]
MTMNAVLPNAQEPPPRVRIAWLELMCLPCGALAGYIEDQRLVRPVQPGAIRLRRGLPRCGRCGGILLAGERGVATSREGIG